MQKFENTLWSGKCPFGERRGNVQPGKCPVGELSVRGNVRRGSVSRGFVLGEESVGEVSGREMSYNHRRRSGIFIVNFERISPLVLVFLLLTLNI